MIARPQTLDAACTLCAIIEEAADQGCPKEFQVQHDDQRGVGPASASTSSSRRHCASRAPRPPECAAPRAPSVNDKLATLCNYISKGSRPRCSLWREKWAHGHHCLAVPQAHAIRRFRLSTPTPSTSLTQLLTPLLNLSLRWPWMS